MNHPLSGFQGQLGSPFTHNRYFKKKKFSQFGSFDFGSSFNGLGSSDFSNQEIINDFSGINGEDDEALSGFGEGDTYLGYSLSRYAKAMVKKPQALKAPQLPKAVPTSYRSMVAKKAASVAAPQSAIHKYQSRMAALVKKHKAAGSAPKVIAALKTAAVAKAVAAAKAEVARRVDTSVPTVNAPINTSIPQQASKDVDTSIPVIANDSGSNGEVVSQGAISLSQEQVSPVEKTVVAAKISPIAHPLAIYGNRAAMIQGLDGFFDDMKNKIIGDAKAAATKAITTAKTNLITSVTKTVTGSDVVQKAAADVAKQNAAEAALAKTQAAAKELVAKTQQAAQYVSENKGKVAGVSAGVLAAGALAAYLMFFRKKTA